MAAPSDNRAPALPTPSQGVVGSVEEQLQDIAARRSELQAVLEAGARLDPYTGAPTTPLEPFERAQLMAQDEVLAYEQQQLQVRSLFEQTRQRRAQREQAQAREFSSSASAAQRTERGATSRKKLAGSAAQMAGISAASSAASRRLSEYVVQRREGSVLERVSDGEMQRTFAMIRRNQDYSAQTIAKLLPAFARLRKEYGMAASQRDAAQQRFSRAIRFSRIITLIAVLAFMVAGISDLLSIFDLGWLASWAIPFFLWVMVLKQRAIQTAARGLVDATRDLFVYQERLYSRQRDQSLNILNIGVAAMQQKIAYAPPPQPTLPSVARSTWLGLITESATVQLIELIPVLDWLPFYTGQVFRRFRATGIASAQARKALRIYETVSLSLTAREMLWLGVWSQAISWRVYMLQLSLENQRFFEERAVEEGLADITPSRSAPDELRTPVDVRAMMRTTPAV